MSETKICSMCNGTGKIEALVSQHDDKTEIVDCPKCNGKKVIHYMMKKKEIIMQIIGKILASWWNWFTHRFKKPTFGNMGSNPIEATMENKIDIKKLVKDNLVTFDYYRAGIMYYIVGVRNENNIDIDSYRFPVRLDDIGDATLLKEDKAMLFMRYIRKAIDNNEIQHFKS